MWPFKPGVTRPMMEGDRSQREEILDGLQQRISREKAILHRRLTLPEPEEEPKRKKRAPSSRARRSRRTGRLYETFQALGEDD
jgi:hypothetical protein